MAQVHDTAAHALGTPKRREATAAASKREKGGKPKRRVTGMRIHKAADGSYSVRHEHEGEQTAAEAPTMLPDTDALHDHIEAQMGEPNPGEDQDEDNEPVSGQGGADGQAQ